MEVTLNKEPQWSKIDHLFVVLGENDKQFPIKSMPRLLRDSGFKGRSEESITLLADEPRKITLIGVGEQKKLTLRAIRAAIYAIGKIAKKQRDRSIAVSVPYQIPNLSAADTMRVLDDLLSQSDYKYDAYITTKDEDKEGPIAAALIPHGIDTKRIKQVESDSRALGAGIRTVRDLGNGPANLVTPAHLAERAQQIARSVGVKCTVFGKKEIEKMKMGGLLAVNQGSVKEPRFIVLEYSPKKAKKHVALVGKGITFDSGGISIKPADRMEEMKFDMCGAAAVIGTIETAAKLELPVKITGAIPSTENLPSGSDYKPGDIVRMMNGKTVEIVNTDAEGRMILGDALHYASQRKPDHLIDYATLTGAMVVALASEAAGLFSNDDELARKLIESG